MKSSRWFLAIPPLGAARVAALQTAKAFKKCIGPENLKIFDTQTHLHAFTATLKKPDENLVVDFVNQALIVSCLDFGTTHLLSFALCPVTLFSLQLLKRQHITTIHWFYEDYQRATYWKTVLRGYDYFLTIQKGPLPEICKNNDVIWKFLPTAASVPIPETLLGTKRDIDVAFIGIPSSYRIKVLEHIAEHSWSLAIAGSGWNEYKGPLQRYILSNNWVNELQSALILQSAKTGINLSVQDPYGREDVHISPRLFDILLSGAICMTEATSLLSETIGDCVVDTFSDLTSLTAAIEKNITVVTHDFSVQTTNSTCVRTKHLYSNRVQDILSFIS